MTEREGGLPRVSHESRLLLLTIVVCVVALLLLARLRFPGTPPVVDTAVQPLERLAARASYDALAADIERVQGVIAPNVVVLRTAPRDEPTPRRVRDVMEPSLSATAVRHVAALRINSTTALASIAPDVRIDAIVGGEPGAGTAEIGAVDPLRRIGRIRVPDSPARPVTPIALSALPTPVYVVAVEGTQAGVTLRPIFLGRGDRFSSPRWDHPLLPLGGTAVSPGALLFTMAGEFVGCVVIEDGATAIAGARDVLATVERLASSPVSPPATLGISVQPLTSELAATLGTDHGVVVAEVDPQGPSADVLRPADAIVTLAGQTLDDVDTFLLRLASHAAGESLPLTIVRRKQMLDLSIVPSAAIGPVIRSERSVSFERTRDGGTKVVADRDGRGHVATGLRPGDLIVAAGGFVDPAPGQLRELLDTGGGLIPFTIRRQGEQRVLAVRAARIDDARR
jgi:hypothetical protein